MTVYAFGSDDRQVKLWPPQYQVSLVNNQNNRTQETDKIGSYLNGSLQAGAYRG